MAKFKVGAKLRAVAAPVEIEDLSDYEFTITGVFEFPYFMGESSTEGPFYSAMSLRGNSFLFSEEYLDYNYRLEQIYVVLFRSPRGDVGDALYFNVMGIAELLKNLLKDEEVQEFLAAGATEIDIRLHG